MTLLERLYPLVVVGVVVVVVALQFLTSLLFFRHMEKTLQ